MFGYTFALNEPVEVDDPKVVMKLAGNSHFEVNKSAGSKKTPKTTKSTTKPVEQSEDE